MQRSYRLRYRGNEAELFWLWKIKMADTSLVSRVKTTAGTRRNNSKNSKKTTRRAASAIWRIFAELDKPKRKLSKINLTSMQVSLLLGCLSSPVINSGRFPFNPKVRKFRLVHQMERTISVWSDRNIRDQLWRWSTVTGLVISVGRTEMSLFICQNCCPHCRSFLSCLQGQVFSSGKWSAVSKAWHLK